MRWTTPGVLAALFVCSCAHAQYAGGVNVDLNSLTGVGSGTPSILFGGAAGQAGYWTQVNPPYTDGSSKNIRDLTNLSNAVTCTFTLDGASTGTFTFNNANTLGDNQLLMDDAHDLGADAARATYTFSSFAPGVYEVITYAAAPDNAVYRTSIVVYTSEFSAGEQTVGGAIPPGGVYTQGVTHARHTVSLAQAGPISIQATTAVEFGTVNGMQIRRLSPTRLYVAPGAATVSNDGLSWESAMGSVQRALAVAAATPSVTEIWVARGVYRADEYPAAAGSALATFRLRSDLALYGGFLGTEATLTERPVFTNASGTVLSGAFQAGGGRVNTVVTADGVGSAVVLDGFEIRDGGGPTGEPGSQGGGLLINNCSPRVSRCTLSGNTAETGGGAYIGGVCDVLFEDCLFTQNAAEIGSAVRSTSGELTSITMRRCAAVRNVCTSGTAGTIGVWCNLVMENCQVTNNDGPSWVMDLSPSPSVTLRNCTVANNRGVLETGASPNVGVYLGRTSTIRNCVIWGNAGGAGAGTPVMTGVLLKGAIDTLDVSDSIVQAWDGTLAGPDALNFAADPRFTSPAPPGNTGSAGNYRVLAGSPARDSGWNSAAPAGPDLGGSARIVDDPCTPNTGFDGGTVDRGCFESVSSCAACPGDIGQAGGLPGSDGLRDNNDYIVFVNYFFANNPLADVGMVGGFPGSDGLFDNNDFIAFINLFFEECP